LLSWRNILGLWPLLVAVIVCGLTMSVIRSNSPSLKNADADAGDQRTNVSQAIR
jgi:hypothetical protein